MQTIGSHEMDEASEVRAFKPAVQDKARQMPATFIRCFNQAIDWENTAVSTCRAIASTEL